MSDTFTESDASRIIAALDARNDRKYNNWAQVKTTWGTVAAVDATTQTLDAYLYGETDSAYISEGFRISIPDYITVGDTVKVAMDYSNGERWVVDRARPAYSPMVAPQHARNLLPNGGFRHGLSGWTLQQNGDTTASMVEWTTSSTWTLRDGDVPSWAAGSTYGSTYSIQSTSAGSHEPYLLSGSIPVMAGEKYSLSALAGTHRVTSVRAVVWFYDYADTYLGSYESDWMASDESMGGGPWLSGWRKLTIDGMVAPALSSYARVGLILTTPFISGTDCYFFMDQVMFTKSDVHVDYQPYEDVSIYKMGVNQVGLDELIVLNERNRLTVGTGILLMRGSQSGHIGDYIFNVYESATYGGVLQFGLGDASGNRDVNLYRSAANTLRTDDSMSVGGDLSVSGWANIGGAATVFGQLTVSKNGTSSLIYFPAASGGNDPARITHIESTSNVAELQFSASDDAASSDFFSFGAHVSGTFRETFRIRADGPMEFSSSTTGGERDVNLYRSAANVLRTSDNMQVDGNLYIGTTGLYYYVSGNGIGLVNAGTAKPLKAGGILVSNSYSDPDPNAKGIQFGADVNLYWGSTNELKTDDKFTAPNIYSGRVTITPVANVQTSATQTFPGSKTMNGTLEAASNADSTVAGGAVAGWAVTNITATTITCYILRSNTTNTGVTWTIVGI